METWMLGLAWSVGSFVACVVRGAWSVLSLDTTQVHEACPTFARAHGWTGEAERRAQSAVFFETNVPRRVIGKMKAVGKDLGTIFRAQNGLAFRSLNGLVRGACSKENVLGTKCEPVLGTECEPILGTESATKIVPRGPPRSPFPDHSARAARPKKKEPRTGLIALPLQSTRSCESWAPVAYVVSKDHADHTF